MTQHEREIVSTTKQRDVTLTTRHSLCIRLHILRSPFEPINPFQGRVQIILWFNLQHNLVIQIDTKKPTASRSLRVMHCKIYNVLYD